MLSFNTPPTQTAPLRPTTLNFNTNNNSNLSQPLTPFGGGFNSGSSSNMNYSNDSTFSTTMKHSKSDYDAFTSIFHIETAEDAPPQSVPKNSIYNFTSSHTMDNLRSDSLNEDNRFLDASDDFYTQTTKHISYPSLYPHVEIVNNNQSMNTKSPPSSPIQQQQLSPSLQSFAPPYAPLTPITPQDTVNINNNYNNNYNNNQYYYNKTNNNNNSSNMTSSSSNLGNAATAPNSAGPNYSHALSASLASTPGVTIMPLNNKSSSASNLFNYGFYDSNNDFNTTTTTAQCKLEVSTYYLLHTNNDFCNFLKKNYYFFLLSTCNFFFFVLLLLRYCLLVNFVIISIKLLL